MRQYSYACSGGPQISNFDNGGVNSVFYTGATFGSIANIPSCLGATYSNNYGPVDSYQCPMQPDCLSNFSFISFPNVQSPDSSNWPSGTINQPSGAQYPNIYSLPILDITQRLCSPTPFIYGSWFSPSMNRPAYTTWNNIVPTQVRYIEGVRLLFGTQSLG